MVVALLRAETFRNASVLANSVTACEDQLHCAKGMSCARGWDFLDRAGFSFQGSENFDRLIGFRTTCGDF
jgi:hypothetical protein